MGRYNFDKENKFKKNNNLDKKENENQNRIQYIEDEYEEYVEDNYLINLIIKGIIIFIIAEMFLLGVGFFTTEKINNRPTVVTIEDRKENAYIKKVNNYLNEIQQNSVKINQIYTLYYQNQNRGTKEADKELKGYLLANQKMIEEVKYMTAKVVPERFTKAHEKLKTLLNTRLITTKSLLNYLRTFSPQHINNYKNYREKYHREINDFANLWNRLISN